MSMDQMPKQVIGLSRLAQLEWEVRQVDDPEAVDFIAVNDTHRVVPYDHALMWRIQSRRITAVSGSLKTDETAPQIEWFAALAAALNVNSEFTSARHIKRDELPENLRSEYDVWIGGCALWVPIHGPRDRQEGGLILLRAEPFSDGEIRILNRIGNAYGQSLTALDAPLSVGARKWGRRRRALLLMTLSLLVMISLMPVHLSVLADARVVPTEPVLITSPLNGVIEDIPVRANQNVAAGDALIKFDQTALKASHNVSRQRVEVLSVNQRRMEQKAFLDENARAEIGLARARLAEGRAELGYAKEQLDRVVVRAPRSGVVLLGQRNEWIGRPVKIGERIMSLANPQEAQLEIYVAVDDALVVNPGSKIDFFLAIRPTNPVAATLTKVSYDARVLPNQSSAFVADAKFLAGDKVPRLGLTGTAKIYGQKVPLYYALLRKPLAALRRILGV